MGFGSYDESEQEKHEVDAHFEEGEGVRSEENTHDGAVEFENGASNDELLSQLQQIKEREE